MTEVIYCEFCHMDPFEYVRVDGKHVAVAISCCEPAITKYYQGLAKMSPKAGSDMLKLNGPEDLQ